MTSRHTGNRHRQGRFEGNGRKPALPTAQVTATRAVPEEVPQATPPAPTNGAAPVIDAREEDIERTMDEWVRVCTEVKERLRDGRNLQDPRVYQEWQLALTLDVFHSAFRFWSGSNPKDLSAEIHEDMIWNFPEFAQELARRARAARLPIEEFMRRAFVPLLNHEEDAGSTAVKFLLGEGFLNRPDVQEIIQDLKDRKKKVNHPVKQEPEDPLELIASVERSSTEG